RQRAIQVITLTVVHAASGSDRFRGCRVVRCASRRQTAVPSGGTKHFFAVDALGEHNRTDRVVEIQVLRANQKRDVGGQRLGGQWTGRDDDRLLPGGGRNRDHLLAKDANQG